jgi:hypothetical protein
MTLGYIDGYDTDPKLDKVPGFAAFVRALTARRQA